MIHLYMSIVSWCMRDSILFSLKIGLHHHLKRRYYGYILIKNMKFIGLKDTY
ncbi:unnamed protein product [Brassica oleracea var. botrytis]